MTDPSAGAAGQLASEMLKEVQDAIKEADKVAQAEQNPSVQFNEVMNTQAVNQVQEVRPGTDTTNVLRNATQAQRTPEVPIVGESINSRPVVSGLQRIMEDVMQGQNKLEEIISLSISGRSFNTSELLALQAGVYRFTQELELTSKVIEKGTSAIKQTLNTQV